MTSLDNLDRQIINDLQRDFPITESPFALLAQRYNTEEEIVIDRIQSMLDSGLLTRFGPMFDAACMGGAFTLAAMEVPEACFDEIAEKVNQFEQVAHNYRRQHKLNMWFVIGTEQQPEIEQVIAQIESCTGIKVHNMPKEEEFYVGLYLPV